MTTHPSNPSYQVLARKYRPKSFHDLLGQEGLVQVLKNALETKRLPHAIILTGVRGVGKTTTARLLAKSLNCTGPDGSGQETITPCDVCPSCLSLQKDTLIDVIEMDAASRTGVDDVREIIETACYKPLSARYKVYIIDEVHMLSKNAFNALLKTLEEPPSHVKFIFATTEIHKVPETVLSRCMRFDLQRVKLRDLVSLMKRLTKQEGFEADEEALSLLARAGNGSARDSLSLLDQALSLNKERLTAEAVRKMLHLADQIEMLHLLKYIIDGNPESALTLFNQLYQKGSDPQVLMTQLLDVIHWIQTLKFSQISEDFHSTAETLELAQNLAGALSVPVLARLWQSLIKGNQEVNTAPDAFKASHMVLIRLCYLAELPTPSEIIARVTASETKTQKPTSSSKSPDKALPPRSHESIESRNLPKTFDDFLELVSRNREPLLAISLKSDVHILDYKPGSMTLYLTEKASKDFVISLKKHLKEWTKWDWQITVSETPGMGSLHSLEEAKEKAKLDNLKKQPLVEEALKAFPNSEITSLKEK